MIRNNYVCDVKIDRVLICLVRPGHQNYEIEGVPLRVQERETVSVEKAVVTTLEKHKLYCNPCGRPYML